MWSAEDLTTYRPFWSVENKHSIYIGVVRYTPAWGDGCTNKLDLNSIISHKHAVKDITIADKKKQKCEVSRLDSTEKKATLNYSARSSSTPPRKGWTVQFITEDTGDCNACDRLHCTHERSSVVDMNPIDSSLSLRFIWAGPRISLLAEPLHNIYSQRRNAGSTRFPHTPLIREQWPSQVEDDCKWEWFWTCKYCNDNVWHLWHHWRTAQQSPSCLSSQRSSVLIMS